jgi:hypothetical protein
MNSCINNGVNKESASLLAMAALFITAIIAKLRLTVETQVPEGYEDTFGFHFGPPQIKD